MHFIDTNIFIYAHDETDPEKSEVARDLIKQLAVSKTGRVSMQVVQEFCNVMLKKSIAPMRVNDLTTIVVAIFMPFLTHTPDAQFLLRTLKTYERYSLSFYDAAIVQAANDIGCESLYSEDMQDGASYNDLKVINPFI